MTADEIRAFIVRAVRIDDGKLKKLCGILSKINGMNMRIAHEHFVDDAPSYTICPMEVKQLQIELQQLLRPDDEPPIAA
jgi:hypothetical protein